MLHIKTLLFEINHTQWKDQDDLIVLLESEEGLLRDPVSWLPCIFKLYPGSYLV